MRTARDIFCAIVTSFVVRYILNAIRGCRAPITVAPAGPTLLGPKSGVRTGLVPISFLRLHIGRDEFFPDFVCQEFGLHLHKEIPEYPIPGQRVLRACVRFQRIPS